jgi:polygalacturonase
MTGKSTRILAILFLFCSIAHAAPATQPINIRDFGAIGDGKTKDTAAFQKALDACTSAGGGVLSIPAGNYLIGSIVMGASTTLTLEKDAILTGSPDINDYPIIQSRFEGKFVPCHRGLIFANKADHIAITGSGKIAGNDALGPLRNPRAPVLMEFIECNDVQLTGFATSYARMWSIHPLFCTDIHASNLTIRSNPNQVNGDGIDVDSCRDVHIEHCDIDTGDDCIALKSGRGMEGVTMGRPTQDVTITDCTLGSGFAGVAVGTEMSGSVINVSIQHCKFTRGANGIYLKSRTERGGFMVNISGEDLDVASTVFLGIDLIDKGIQDPLPVQGFEGFSLLSNVKFTNVKVNCQKLLDGRLIPPEKPMDQFELSNVTGTCRSAITLSNVNHARLDNINVTGFSGKLMNLTNVTIDPPQKH